MPFDLIDTMRAYLTQLRQELGLRFVEAVFDPQTDKPSKVPSSSCNYDFPYNIWNLLQIRHSSLMIVTGLYGGMSGLETFAVGKQMSSHHSLMTPILKFNIFIHSLIIAVF